MVFFVDLGCRIDATYRWGNGGKFKKCMIPGRRRRGPRCTCTSLLRALRGYITEIVSWRFTEVAAISWERYNLQEGLNASGGSFCE